VGNAIGPIHRAIDWMWHSLVVGLAALAVATPIYLWLGRRRQRAFTGRTSWRAFLPPGAMGSVNSPGRYYSP